MVSPSIKDYTSENPYRLVWRCDFDPTLESVLLVSGCGYEYNEKTKQHEFVGIKNDNIKELAKSEIWYLTDINTFVDNWCSGSKKELNNLKDGSTYIDVINEGWPNADGKTYSYKQYWQTEKGATLMITEGNDRPLSENGLFCFDDLEFPSFTRIFADGKLLKDYRKPNRYMVKKTEEPEL